MAWAVLMGPHQVGKRLGLFPSFEMGAMIPQLITLGCFGEGVLAQSYCEQRARANARQR